MPSDAETVGENTVGKLQEVCMFQKWNFPIYETLSEEGLPHDKTFRISCVVPSQPYQEIGVAKTKKLAKRVAAHLMLQHFGGLAEEMEKKKALSELETSEPATVSSLSYWKPFFF